MQMPQRRLRRQRRRPSWPGKAACATIRPRCGTALLGPSGRLPLALTGRVVGCPTGQHDSADTSTALSRSERQRLPTASASLCGLVDGRSWPVSRAGRHGAHRSLGAGSFKNNWDLSGAGEQVEYADNLLRRGLARPSEPEPVERPATHCRPPFFGLGAKRFCLCVASASASALAASRSIRTAPIASGLSAA